MGARDADDLLATFLMDDRYLGDGITASYRDDRIVLTRHGASIPLAPGPFEALIQYNRDLVEYLRVVVYEANRS